MAGSALSRKVGKSHRERGGGMTQKRGLVMTASTELYETRLVSSSSPLAAHHRQLLREGSGISERIILGRDYRTGKEPKDLRDLGFEGFQCRTPALIIHMYGPDGMLKNSQIRPDDPRMDPKTGRPIRYESPAGSEVVLDCHPFNLERLMDPREPLWITEGIRKGDSGASRDLLVLSLQGVWGWMHDGAPHPDWGLIPLVNRIVYLAFDADITHKENVRQALSALTGFLWERRAYVYVIPLERVRRYVDG